MIARAHRSRIATSIGALTAAALLAGCAAAAEPEEVDLGAPSPSPSASPTPTAEPTTVTTQNGTASFALPAGWTVQDDSLLEPMSNHGGPIWQNWLTVLDEDAVVRARYGDGYADDVGAAADRGVVQAIAMPGGLHAAAWWSTAADGVWQVQATVVDDPSDPNGSVMLDGVDRLHSFSSDLAAVPECGSVVDEASAIACLEAPDTTEVLELLATLELEPLPWDAMPDGVDPVADVPWVDYVSADGGIAFSHPEGWTVEELSSPDGPFVVLSTPDGFQALDVATYRDRAEFPFVSDCAPGTAGLGPFTVLERVPIEPLVGALQGTAASTLEAVTLEVADLVIVAVLSTSDVDAGCLDPGVLVAGGMIRATTPYQTDAPGLIYDRYADRRLPVGSYEHRVIVEVLGTLRLSALDAS
ncbi:hypothetical protein [Agrococcus sp. SGAir0287]|uniref:hypothetical protein n=1 Tax=Agrococcus sp. SGAir0287 TaxID=2070347 RepID=UPI0010CD63AC|nr:hypothetical protein [Agrococcus sp. SGAir0287]QCR20147.1 hypothetical protein C1N71_12440 [Agrococcus sp. SGAir0287]